MTDSQTADLGRRKELRSMARESLERQQFKRLREMLVRVVPENTFYRQRFVDAGLLDASGANEINFPCLLYTSPSPRDATLSRMPSSA